ncbi:hypothetical protein A9Q78_01895 [Methylophaga sp. 41_12_T18]|nr:hypothetical protein A9Q78_01895 [Methylophaga sp. 41_12_T18]
MSKSYKYQQGAATLVVSVVLLLILTLVTIYAARVGLQDQRISGNDYRAKKAFSAAQAGLDYGEAFIQNNVSTYLGSLTTCPDLVTFPCNYAAATTWQYNDVSSGILSSLDSYNVGYLLDTNSFLTVVSTGTSEDTTGNAVVREQISILSVLNNGPLPPVMAVDVTAGGTFTVLGNPNVGTDSVFADASGKSKSGQLFSTWSKEPQNLGGSLQTCYPGDFQDNSGTQCIGPTVPDDFGNLPTWNQCSCLADSVYSSTNTGGSVQEDVVEEPGSSAFDDAFSYVFSRSRAEIKNLATEVANCDVIDEDSGEGDSSIYWVTGNCDKNGGEMGSLADPIIIIVVGDISFQGQAHAWGIVMGIDASETPPVTSGCLNETSISVVGGFSMHGALVSDCSLNLGAGTFNAMYIQDVFDNFASSSNTNFLSRSAGSWRDF